MGPVSYIQQQLSSLNYHRQSHRDKKPALPNLQRKFDDCYLILVYFIALCMKSITVTTYGATFTSKNYLSFALHFGY